MTNDLRAIQVVTRRAFLATRIPHAIRVVSIAFVLSIFAMILITPTLAQTVDFRPVLVAIAVLSIALLYSILRLLQMNPVGLFEEGIAPPEKSLADLLKDRSVILWNHISSIKLTTVEEDPPPLRGTPSMYYIVELNLATGDIVDFTGSEINRRFRSDAQARRFYALLLVARRNLKHGHTNPLQLSDNQVQALLSAKWPEEYTFRRSTASRIGIVFGGLSSLVALSLVLARLIGIVVFAAFWVPMLSLFLLSLGFPHLPHRSPRPRRSPQDGSPPNGE